MPTDKFRDMDHMAEPPISVAVVIPVYSGAATLPDLIRELSTMTTVQRTSGGLRFVVESVVLAWDHGPDRSDEVIRELAVLHDWVRPVWLSRNYGQHPATCAGILATGTDWIVTMDEDGQHDPADIPVLLDRAYESRCQLVYAKPSNEPPHGFVRNLASRAAKGIFKVLMGDGAPKVDFHSFRLVAGGAGRVVAASVGPGVYLDVALAWAIPEATDVAVPMRVEGRPATNYSTRRLLSHFWRLVLSSGTKPLRIIAGIGLVAAFVGFVLGVVVLVQKLTGAVEVRGWTTLMVLTLVGGGLILLSLGVIAEYLGMIAARSMGRSGFLVTRDPALAFPGSVVDETD
jgi:glycosyltransferase involved in cell wall biosynthesis